MMQLTSANPHLDLIVTKLRRALIVERLINHATVFVPHHCAENLLLIQNASVGLTEGGIGPVSPLSARESQKAFGRMFSDNPML